MARDRYSARGYGVLEGAHVLLRRFEVVDRLETTCPRRGIDMGTAERRLALLIAAWLLAPSGAKSSPDPAVCVVAVADVHQGCDLLARASTRAGGVELSHASVVSCWIPAPGTQGNLAEALTREA